MSCSHQVIQSEFSNSDINKSGLCLRTKSAYFSSQALFRDSQHFNS